MAGSAVISVVWGSGAHVKISSRDDTRNLHHHTRRRRRPFPGGGRGKWHRQSSRKVPKACPIHIVDGHAEWVKVNPPRQRCSPETSHVVRGSLVINLLLDLRVNELRFRFYMQKLPRSCLQIFFRFLNWVGRLSDPITIQMAPPMRHRKRNAASAQGRQTERAQRSMAQPFYFLATSLCPHLPCSLPSVPLGIYHVGHLWG